MQHNVLNYNRDVRIEGDINSGVEIHIKRGHSLTVGGNVGNNVKINSHNAVLKINGNIGNNCTIDIYNGEINVGDVGEGSLIKTYNAKISCGNVSQGATLRSYNGKINAKNVSENVKIISHNGKIAVETADKSAVIQSEEGDVTIAGVRQPKEEKKSEKYTGRVTVSEGESLFGRTKTVTYHDPVVVKGNFIL